MEWLTKRLPAKEPRSQEPRVQVVRAYIVFFLPEAISIAYQSQEGWLLPGGIVEGPGRPDNVPGRLGEHFYPLAGHVATQTGLTLVGLTDGVALTFSQPGDRLEATVLYIGETQGRLQRGEILDPAALPMFSPICGSPEDLVRRYHEKPKQEMLKVLGEVGGIEGVFVTKKPTDKSRGGNPCHHLLRLYDDGAVLHIGYCGPGVAQGWPEIRKWFNRDSSHEMGRGLYHRESGRLWFTTTGYFSQTSQIVVMDFAGEYRQRSLKLAATSRLTCTQTMMEFVRLDLDLNQ
jgi:hypothetical protein